MNNNLFSWVLLTIFGICLTLFTLYYGLFNIENYYHQSLIFGKEEVLKAAEISHLKSENSEFKKKIESLSAEVNDLGKKMNNYLFEYRKSKQYLDSLINVSDQNGRTIDTIVTYYNNTILNSTNVIDSINRQYEIKSTTLLKFITDLESNSADLELALLEKSISNKMITVKVASIVYFVFIFLISLFLGIWITVFGVKKIKSAVI